MEFDSIKFLVETFPRIELEEAQEAIVNGHDPEIKLSGRSDGERLSEVIAALWVLEKMNQEQVDIVTAFSAYQESLR
ncbi:MAG: DUF6952 family protein [Cyclobacteriaceae bacterium]